MPIHVCSERSSPAAVPPAAILPAAPPHHGRCHHPAVALVIALFPSSPHCCPGHVWPPPFVVPRPRLRPPSSHIPDLRHRRTVVTDASSSSPSLSSPLSSPLHHHRRHRVVNDIAHAGAHPAAPRDYGRTGRGPWAGLVRGQLCRPAISVSTS